MGRTNLRCLLAMIAWVGASGPLSVTPAMAQVGTEFGAVGPAWQAAWNARNSAAAAALFAPNAVFVHASGEQVVGEPAIAALFKSVLEVNTPSIGMTPLTQVMAGNGGWISGTYQETIASPSRPSLKVHGHYLLVLRRTVSSAWRIERMMWSDEP